MVVRRKRQGWAGAVAAGLLGLTLLAAQLPAAADQLTEEQARAKRVEQALAGAQSQYAAAQAAWADAHRSLVRLQSEIDTTNNQIQQLQTQIATDQQKAATLQTQIDATQARADDLQNQADAGLVLLQQRGTVSFLSVVLGAHSFNDFLTRVTYLTRIWSNETGLLKATRAAQQKLQAQHGALNRTLADVQSSEAKAQAHRAALVTERTRADAVRREEAKAQADAGAAIRSLTKKKAGIIAAINALLAKIRAGKISWPQVMAIVHSLAAQYHIDPRLVEAVIIAESGGDASARSDVGAEGLMQLMPGTAAGLGVTDAYDPVQNVRGGIAYLLQMLQLFHGNLKLAIAAYNAGPGAVKKYGGIPPYAETQNYVREVLGLYNQGK